jgi:formate dehydrogenase maturation protein FdhE
MAVHDEVMPKMRDIRQLTKRLKAVDKTETNEEIQNAISTLSEADETMMDWMAQFKMPKDASVEDELNFLNGQMKSVNEMKSKMLGAINNAQNLLNKLENE